MVPVSIQSSPVTEDEVESSVFAVRTLVDDLLAEQSELQTPVQRFADTHEREPDLAGHYRSLIPLSRPGPDEQYAFEVALDRCTGCKACVSACHSMNGLDEEESWRDVGAILGGDSSPGWQQTVTTACHHCADPGCLTGCPVGAYEKEVDTGIVRHLDDQCIGCSYCILKCPYDVPKYSKKRGIVRKCDMCHQRLEQGEAPACVQACPTEAIRIVTVPTRAEEERAESMMSGEGSASALPDESITRPTTRYTGREVPVTAHAADRAALVVEHAHWPLVLMLVLTQSGIGLLLATCLTPSYGPSVAATGAGMFLMGMVASVFHLGQPLKAWRFFLGLRTSWLSREILAFAILTPLLVLWVCLPLMPDFALKGEIVNAVRWLLPPLGLAAIFTSVMVYHDTMRSLWRINRGGVRFFSTTLLSMLLVSENLLGAIAFGVLLLAKLAWECFLLRRCSDDIWTPDAHSARLLAGPLRLHLIIRCLIGVFAIPVAFPYPWIALLCLLAGEVFERLLFFRAVCAPKMPGNFGPEPATP